MKNSLLTILILVAVPFSSMAQNVVQYIGNEVTKEWLFNFFDNHTYNIISGSFDTENKPLLNGEVVGFRYGRKATISTTSIGRCYSIYMDLPIDATPREIKQNADQIMISNGCQIIKEDFYDGLNADMGEMFVDLDYEGRVQRGYNFSTLYVITLWIQAHGSYNSFGKYFPNIYNLHCVGTGKGINFGNDIPVD